MNSNRLAFLAAIPVAREVIARPAVAEAWDRPSALRKFTVGGLAGHLARSVITVRTYLEAPPPAGAPLITAAAYYLPIPAGGDLDSELNAAVRRRGEAEAAGGQSALLGHFDAAAAWLAEGLLLEPAGRALRAFGDTAILIDEYLATRLVELALHVDDLCASLDADTPAIPGIDIAIHTLLGVARARHGDLAVLRALGRRERDPGQALRVF